MKSATAKTSLTELQQQVVQHYEGGEFAYVKSVEEAREVGDSLFLFLLIEAGDAFDKAEYLGMLEAASKQVDAVRNEVAASQPAKQPRVLVRVARGVADYVSDDGIAVEIFDWDNYNADPAATGGVPRHFADLAMPLDIPVEGEGSPT